MAGPDFIQDLRSGLYLPDTFTRSQKQLAEAAEKQARGKFFSAMGKAERYNQAGAQEKPPDEPSFRYLRDAYYESVIDQICVMRRQQQVRALCRRVRNPETEVGWQVVHIDHDRPDFEETDEIRTRCAEMEDIIENGPTPEVHPGGFADFAVASVEEELVVDRKTLIRFKDRAGFPRQFHLVDGATVKPIVRVLYEWIEEHKGEENQWGPDMWDVAAESLSYEVGFDLTRAAYVQEVDGVIVAAWSADQIDIDITNPAVEINRLAFGRGSAFQRSMTLTDLAISMVDYNRGLFSVDYPENALFLFGDYSPSGLEAFTRQLTSQVGNRNWSRLAIIPADQEFKASLQKLRDTPKDMVFDRLWQLVIALKAAAYIMHPSEINAAGYESEAPAMNQPNEEKQIAYAKEEGLHGLVRHNADWINRAIVRPRYPDLRMRWHVRLDTERERVEMANMRVQQYGSINEARKAENKSPIAKPWADYPMQIAAIYAQAETQQQALQMQQKAASQQQAAERAHETDMASQESAERLAAGESRPREQSGQQSWPRGNAGPVRGVGQKRRQASAAAQRGATGLPRTSTEHGLQESARRVVVSARGMHAEADDGRIRLKVRGRTYLLESGPYGATWRAPNGAVVLHSDRVPDSPEGAAAELEEALEDARGA